MHKLGKSEPCPRCKVKDTRRHCSSTACLWRTCYTCVTNRQIIVFDSKGHFFFREYDQ